MSACDTLPCFPLVRDSVALRMVICAVGVAVSCVTLIPLVAHETRGPELLVGLIDITSRATKEIPE